MKANNNPIVRVMRRILDQHGWDGGVAVFVSKDGKFCVYSAGKTVKSCDAIGKRLKRDEFNAVAEIIDEALYEASK